MSRDTESQRQFFALLDAVENCSVEGVRRALAAGADLRLSLSSGHTALSKAVRNESVEVVEVIIDAARSQCGRSWFDAGLVRAACREPSALTSQFVHLILAAGANPSASTAGSTALQGAVYARNVDATRLLIEAGADVNGNADDCNVVPLLFAMGAGGRMFDDHGGPEATLWLVEALARAGADAGYVPAREWAPPVLGFLTPYQYAMSKGLLDIVTSLTHLANQDPRQVTADGRSMLDLLPRMVASRTSTRDLLLSLGTEMDVRGSMECGSEESRPAKVVTPSL
jgi:ankyrin repeat protein